VHVCVCACACVCVHACVFVCVCVHRHVGVCARVSARCLPAGLCAVPRGINSVSAGTIRLACLEPHCAADATPWHWANTPPSVPLKFKTWWAGEVRTAPDGGAAGSCGALATPLAWCCWALCWRAGQGDRWRGGRGGRAAVHALPTGPSLKEGPLARCPCGWSCGLRPSS